jgi:Uma2 family endonuclease
LNAAWYSPAVVLPGEQVEPATLHGERRFVLEDVPWWTYVALRDGLEHSGTRMTYLEGRLELMSPSERHEEETALIARLLETWADEKDVDLRGFRSTTCRREAKRGGLEPDECYTVGIKATGAVPQIAIEVIVTNPLVDKLEVYARLGVQEVWVWHSSMRRLVVNRLTGPSYAQHGQSAILTDLDLALLTSFVRAGESHTGLVKEYRKALRG